MQKIQHHFFKALKNGQWGLAIILGSLLLAGLITFALLQDRIQNWANNKIDQQGAQLMSSFVGSIWLPVVLFGLLAVVWAATVHWLWPRNPVTAPPVKRNGLLPDIRFDSRTILTEPQTIGITKLKDTDPIIEFNILIETTQWPLEIKAVSGEIYSLGKIFPLPLRVRGLPIVMRDIHNRSVIIIEQPVSPERAAELSGLLSKDGGMVSFDFSWTRFEGTAHLPGKEEDFVVPLREGFEVKGPVPDINPHMAMTAKIMVSSVYYDNYGNRLGAVSSR